MLIFCEVLNVCFDFLKYFFLTPKAFWCFFVGFFSVFIKIVDFILVYEANGFKSGWTVTLLIFKIIPRSLDNYPRNYREKLKMKMNSERDSRLLLIPSLVLISTIFRIRLFSFFLRQIII